MQILKTGHPRTLADIYDKGTLVLPKQSDLQPVHVLIVDVRPPVKGEYYIRANGSVQMCLQTNKNKRMTRIIVEVVEGPQLTWEQVYENMK